MKISIASVTLSTLILPAGLCMLLAACRPGTQQAEITPRNTTVNKSNAYNNLFLDSAAVEKFITKQQLNDTIANVMRSFYNARNYEYAWFDARGLTEQALGFRSLYDYSQDTGDINKQLEARLNELASEDDTTISARDAGIVKTELQLTQRFIKYAQHTFDDLSPSRLEQFIPIKKHRTIELADSVLSGHNNYAADNPAYKRMKELLSRYVDITKKGGWVNIAAGKKKYRKGDEGPAIAAIRERLQVTGEKDKRAYSHGCIRLSNPVKMVHYVLQDTPGWPSEKIDSALNERDKEKYVKVKSPIPVLIIYYTAWVDEQGTLQLREDIYGHDAELAQKMFSDAPSAP